MNNYHLQGSGCRSEDLDRMSRHSQSLRKAVQNPAVFEMFPDVAVDKPGSEHARQRLESCL